MESSTMDHSLNSARQSLRVGKIRLYNYLDELGIEPTLNGNSKLITDKQLEEIRTAIQAEALSQQNPEDNLQNRIKRQKTVPEDIQDNPKTASQNNLNNGTIYSNLRDEITHLRKLLESEQQERQEKDKRHDEVLKEFNQSTERFQAMLMQLQTKNNELSQKLLEAPKGKEEVTVSREAFKDTEREVVATSETIQPVPEQPVQAQHRFFTTVIWAAAAVLLTISIVELGGFSISSVVRDLLASR
jgi:chromosome segregation ATPase